MAFNRPLVFFSPLINSYRSLVSGNKFWLQGVCALYASAQWQKKKEKMDVRLSHLMTRESEHSNEALRAAITPIEQEGWASLGFVWQNITRTQSWGSVGTPTQDVARSIKMSVKVCQRRRGDRYKRKHSSQSSGQIAVFNEGSQVHFSFLAGRKQKSVWEQLTLGCVPAAWICHCAALCICGDMRCNKWDWNRLIAIWARARLCR